MRLAHLVAFATVTLAASLTGCASHHHAPPAAASETSDLAAGTSCEGGDSACTCVDIHAGDYDDVCKVDSDCVAITVGTICGAASCLPANAAVNKDSYAAFQQDRQQVEYASCVPVANGTVSCVSNACVLQGAAGSARNGQPGGGSSAGANGSGDDGTGTGIEIDLGDDDDTTVTVPDPPTAGDDDDDGNGGSSSGDDDDDDDKDGKRHPHPQSRHGHGATHVRSPAVTDILD